MEKIKWNSDYEEKGAFHGKMDAIKEFLDWNYGYSPLAEKTNLQRITYFDKFSTILERERGYRMLPNNKEDMEYYQKTVNTREYKFGYDNALREQMNLLYRRFETFIAESAEKATRKLYEQKAQYFRFKKGLGEEDE